MRKQGPRPATGGDWLLVAGVMAMMLGLLIAGAGFVGLESPAEVAPETKNSPASSALPAPADAPPIVEHATTSGSACIPTFNSAAALGSAAAVSSDEDPRAYLARMAALPHHRAVTAATVGPYQASLDPALYRPPGSSPFAPEGGFTAGSPSQTCPYR